LKPSKQALILAVPVILVTALVVRLVPYQWSPLPFNIDGLSEYRVADYIMTYGHLEFPVDSSVAAGYVSDMPLLGLVIAFVSASLGLDPLVSSQLVTALLGAVAVCVAFILVRKHWHFSFKASLSAGLVLALAGSFVFSAGCTWKETLGILLTLIVLYAYPLRDHRSYRVLMTLALPLLVFTHHHSTIVAYVIVTFAMVIDHASKATKPFLDDRAFYDILTIMVIWALAVWYYILIDLPYLDYLSPQTCPTSTTSPRRPTCTSTSQSRSCSWSWASGPPGATGRSRGRPSASPCRSGAPCSWRSTTPTRSSRGCPLLLRSFLYQPWDISYSSRPLLMARGSRWASAGTRRTCSWRWSSGRFP